jgi:hypothetical protein
MSHGEPATDSAPPAPFKRPLAFVVTDPRYMYPAAVFVLALGIAAAFWWHDATVLPRAGNFIIGIGVWMTMRYTLREGINRHKNMAASSPLFPGTNMLNAAYFNEIGFLIGDAKLQIHGFVLVISGSVVGSFGDIILKAIFPCLV